MSIVLAPRSKKEIDHEIAIIRKAAKKVNRTDSSALAFLVKHGFLTKGGKLTKQYR